jgi:hypothetical protein
MALREILFPAWDMSADGQCIIAAAHRGPEPVRDDRVEREATPSRDPGIFAGAILSS